MILSKNDYKYHLKIDSLANGGGSPRIIGDELWKYTRLLRKYEYYKNCNKNRLITLYLHWKFKVLSIKYGFSIPINVFGPGLKIIHRGTIVVNPAAVVGANARLNPGVVIGAKMGTSNKAPVIGKNCYFAPGAKIIGDIVLGENIVIGANATVVKNAPDNVTIAGTPAKIISKHSSKDYFTFLV